MARTASITFEDVAKAASSLSEKGQKITITNVKEALGRGSPATISRYIKLWQAKQDFTGAAAMPAEPSATPVAKPKLSLNTTAKNAEAVAPEKTETKKPSAASQTNECDTAAKASKTTSTPPAPVKDVQQRKEAHNHRRNDKTSSHKAARNDSDDNAGRRQHNNHNNGQKNNNNKNRFRRNKNGQNHNNHGNGNNHGNARDYNNAYQAVDSGRETDVVQIENLENLTDNELAIKIRRLEGQIYKEQSRREAAEKMAREAKEYAEIIKEQIAQRIHDVKEALETTIEQLHQEARQAKVQAEADLKYYREHLAKANNKILNLTSNT